MLKETSSFLFSIIEKKPSMGYLGAAFPTWAGFWVLLQKMTAIAAFLSIAIGIAVGIVTFIVQRETLRKLRDETKNKQT